MSNYKLVQDYLNKNSNIIDENIIVNGVIDRGTYVDALIEYDKDNQRTSTYVEISIYDLINFIYTKN